MIRRRVVNALTKRLVERRSAALTVFRSELCLELPYTEKYCGFMFWLILVAYQNERRPE
jgi:DNA-binding transcriptional MocR family regulator